MSYELKVKFLTSIISIGISFCIIEVFLTFPADDSDIRIQKAKEIGIEFDTRSKLEVINYLKNIYLNSKKEFVLFNF